MTKTELAVIGWVKKNVNMLFFFAILTVSVLIRLYGLGYVSRDMQVFLLPWYETIKQNGGLLALNSQVGDYNLLFQTIIALMTYIDVNPIYLYKLVSILFDYLLAFCVANNLTKLTNRSTAFFNSVFAVLIFLPTVVINSSYWGQCDAAYTLFVFMTLFSLYYERYARAFVWLGLAFAFKLQAIFLVPFLICYYFYKKRFSLLYFGISALCFWASGTVAYIFGRSLLDPIRIYVSQTGTYPHMWFNFTSFWRLLGDDYEGFGKLAILTTLIICGLGFYAVILGKKKIESLEQFFNTATWFVWVMVMFLPAMHERYAFLLDAMLIALSFISVKYIKYACVSLLLSLAVYGNYLNGIGELSLLFVFLYFAALAFYSYEIFFKEKTVKQI